MSITATPTLTVADVTLGQSPASGQPLLAVDELRITWGRGSVFESPKPSTAALTVLDRTAGATFARRTDLIGQPVRLGWSTSDGFTGGPNFRGRITDVAVLPLPGAVAGGGMRVQLACSSSELDIAQVTVPGGTAFPAETFAARKARLVALLPAGSFPGGVLLPDRLDLGLAPANVPAAALSGLTAAPVTDAGGRSVLELLRELFTSTAPLPMVYDVRNDALIFAPRPRYAPSGGTHQTLTARLIASPDHGGRYVAASLAGRHLDGGRLEYSGPLTQPLDARITRVEVDWSDPAASYDARTVAAATTSAFAGLEATIGRRLMRVGSLHTVQARAQDLAFWFADVASREATTPRLGPLGYSTAREPFHDAAHATMLLEGYETSTALFLGHSWLPQLGQRPLVTLLGGTIVYAAGNWSVGLTPGPVIVDPEGYRWGPVTARYAASTAAVRLSDVDPSVTWGDLAFVDVGAGYTSATQPAYPGNPT